MAENVGTHLDKNPFTKAMNTSIPVSAEISQFVSDALNSQKGTDPKIKALFLYYDPINKAFQIEAPLQTSNVISKVAATNKVVVTVKGMKVGLKDWTKQIGNVYPEDSFEYNRLLIGGTKGFYNGSRAKRLIRVNALITAIGADPLLATLKAEIQVYADALTSSKALQTTGKTTVVDDSADINRLRDACTKGLWYVYAGLLMIFIDTPSKALGFFPMQLIYEASNQKSYTMVVPAHIIKRVCLHLFKEGETATITNNRSVPINIGLALTSKSDVLLWYTILAGDTKTVTPDELGNVLFKFVMAENLDLIISGDITFTINAAA